MAPTPPSTRSPSRLPTILGIVSIASATLLLLGALQRNGSLGNVTFLWNAWASAPAAIRFLVMLAVFAGLFGCGAWAMTLSWRTAAQVNLLACCGFLIAGIALVVGATYNKQWGASQTVPMVIAGVVAAGFVAVLLSAYRRFVVKSVTKASPDVGVKDP